MTDREKIAIETIKDVFKACKEDNPEKFKDAPEPNEYNLREIYDYLRR